MDKLIPFERLLPVEQELIARIHKEGRVSIRDLGSEPVMIGHSWFDGVWDDGTKVDPTSPEHEAKFRAGADIFIVLTPEAQEACKSIDFTPKSPIRKLADPDPTEGRVESGPIQFGDDWPGVFIRGDQAAGFALFVRKLADKASSPMTQLALSDLAELLESSNVHAMQETENGV